MSEAVSEAALMDFVRSNADEIRSVLLPQSPAEQQRKRDNAVIVNMVIDQVGKQYIPRVLNPDTLRELTIELIRAGHTSSDVVFRAEDIYRRLDTLMASYREAVDGSSAKRSDVESVLIAAQEEARRMVDEIGSRSCGCRPGRVLGEQVAALAEKAPGRLAAARRSAGLESPPRRPSRKNRSRRGTKA